MALLQVINDVLHWHAYEGQTFAPVTSLYSDGLRDSNKVVLAISSVADGQYLKRQGSNIVGTSTIIAEVDYTPAVLTDWTGSVDPGGMDEALDQLASRLTIDVAGLASHTADTVDPHGSTMTVSALISTSSIQSFSNTGKIVIDAKANPGSTYPSQCTFINSGGLGPDTTVDITGNLTLTGTVDGRDVSVDGATLDAHVADTVDPHGSTTTISVKVLTPKVESTGAVLILNAPSASPSTLLIQNTGGGGSCNVSITGNITVTGTVDGRDVSVDGASLDTHLADTVDPHGSSMTVSAKIDTPKIEYTGAAFNFNILSGGTSTVYVDNDGGDCDLNVNGNIIGIDLSLQGSITVGGTVDSVDIAARDAVLTSHMANTADPHGASMSVSTKVITPKIETTGSLMTIDVSTFSTATFNVTNTNAGVCDIAADGEIRADKNLKAGQPGNQIDIDPATGTITPTGTASPIDIKDLTISQLGILPGSGNYTVGQGTGVENGGFSPQIDTLYCVPIVIGRQITIDALAISIITQAGQKIRLGIYDIVASTGLPKTLLAEATEIVTSTNSTLEIATLGSSLTLPPDLYYVAMVVNAGSLQTGATYAFSSTMMMAAPLSSFVISYSMFGQRAYTYAALPSSWGTPTNQAGAFRAPRIALREA